MSASIDFSEIREMTIAFSGLSHMDNEFLFCQIHREQNGSTFRCNNWNYRKAHALCKRIYTSGNQKRNGIIISTARKEYLSAEQSD